MRISPQETFLLCTLLWALIFSQQRKEDIDINVKLQTKNIFLHRQQTISILPASTDCYRAIDIHTFSHLHFIAFAELPPHKRVRQDRRHYNWTTRVPISLARATCSTITLSSPGQVPDGETEAIHDTPFFNFHMLPSTSLCPLLDR